METLTRNNRKTYIPEGNLRLDQRYVQKLAVGNKKEIPVTHVTVRQSISLLLSKLIVIEAIAAGTLISFHLLFFTTDIASQLPVSFSLFNIPIFLTLVCIKTFIMFFVIFQWLDEYYEITPSEIIYRKGYFFKHEEHHVLNHLVSLRVTQGAIGKFLNFGTLTLFNWAKNEEFSMYLIHNPMKYLQILEYLMPEPDTEKEIIRDEFIEQEIDEKR